MSTVSLCFAGATQNCPTSLCGEFESDLWLFVFRCEPLGLPPTPQAKAHRFSLPAIRHNPAPPPTQPSVPRVARAAVFGSPRSSFVRDFADRNRRTHSAPQFVLVTQTQCLAVRLSRPFVPATMLADSALLGLHEKASAPLRGNASERQVFAAPRPGTLASADSVRPSTPWPLRMTSSTVN